MFNSQILDAAIGLVTVYFFLSLLCSVIVEMFTGLTKKRARMLRDGILALLQDPAALNKLYEQPLFMGNSAPKGLLQGLRESFKGFSLKKKTFPSYISSRSFVLSLLESLKQHPDVVKKLLKDNDLFTIENFKKKLNSLADRIESTKRKVEDLAKENGPDERKRKVEDLLKENGPGEWQQKMQDLLKVIDSDTWQQKVEDLLKENGPEKWKKNVDDLLQENDENKLYDKIADQPDIFKEIVADVKSKIPTMNEVAKIRTMLDSLSDDNTIKKALLPLLDAAGTAADSLDKFIQNMEKWYDEAMERVTGWYKRYSQAIALSLAFVVALVLNADTFQIGKAIYRDQALRTSLVQVAEEAVKKHPSAENKDSQGEQQNPAVTSPSKEPEGKKDSVKSSSPNTPTKVEPDKGSTPTVPDKSTQSREAASGAKSTSSDVAGWEKQLEEVNNMSKQINSVNLPIGWRSPPSGWYDYLVKLLGILLTALMVSLGSNFWFELLSKLINLRNAGKKPLTREEQDAQKN